MKNNDVPFILNPLYNLKSDVSRAIIYNREGGPLAQDFLGYVHPIFAILIALFDGKKLLSQVIYEASKLLGKEESVLSDIILPLIENDEALHFHFDGYHQNFPEQLLVPNSNGGPVKRFDYKDFLIPKKSLDLKSWRLNTPLDIWFMVNTLCVTDCIYCYADRSKRIDCQIPVERLKELIREAKELGMRAIDTTGGELFLYKYWEPLIAELLDNGFFPYISTKYPVTEDIIGKLKNLGIKRIQVSLDSVNKDEMKKMLNVGPDYFQKMMTALRRLDDNEMDIFINAQLTSFNQHSIDQLLEFVFSLKHLKRINMGAAVFSLYKGPEEYKRYKADLDIVRMVEKKMNVLKGQYKEKINVNFSGYATKQELVGSSSEEKKKRFKERSRCSGNFYTMIILPDGKVTICEELYWQPQFIIGDLNTQSIAEVWNSKRALELYNLSADDVSDTSACKNCDEFDACHKYRGVCWKEVLYAYGMDNWDYPDPKCHHAPEPFREFYL